MVLISTVKVEAKKLYVFAKVALPSVTLGTMATADCRPDNNPYPGEEMSAAEFMARNKR